MTNLEKATKKAIKDWCRSNTSRAVDGVRHIYPRGYVVAKPGAGCIVVALPPQDRESHLKGCRTASDNSAIIRDFFEEHIEPGMWVSVAYVTSGSTGIHVAIEAVENVK